MKQTKPKAWRASKFLNGFKSYGNFAKWVDFAYGKDCPAACTAGLFLLFLSICMGILGHSYPKKGANCFQNIKGVFGTENIACQFVQELYHAGNSVHTFDMNKKRADTAQSE